MTGRENNKYDEDVSGERKISYQDPMSSNRRYYLRPAVCRLFFLFIFDIVFHVIDSESPCLLGSESGRVAREAIFSSSPLIRETRDSGKETVKMGER